MVNAIRWPYGKTVMSLSQINTLTSPARQVTVRGQVRGISGLLFASLSATFYIISLDHYIGHFCCYILEYLVSLQFTTRNELMSLNRGIAIRRPREARYVMQDAIYKRLGELYDQDQLDIPRFLAAANHCLRFFGNRVLIESSGKLDDFVTAQFHNISE